ncbi:hypothetical protein SORBI_3002G218400 [Sorghum bicolor]|uniref:Uncharacterized protein n=1 Tax=Sorghum bicolor TaxID=4558 RepID=A0A1B6QCV2_SORBI|nr:hypothetical protein SORBI_3002G218400 [Sorghum bicolor]
MPNTESDHHHGIPARAGRQWRLPRCPDRQPHVPVFGHPRWLPPKEQQQQQDVEEEEDPDGASTTTVRVPLGRLLLEEPWCDNTDAELDGVPAETYCLWSPGVSPPPLTGSPRQASPERCWRSGSRCDGGRRRRLVGRWGGGGGGLAGRCGGGLAGRVF